MQKVMLNAILSYNVIAPCSLHARMDSVVLIMLQKINKQVKEILRLSKDQRKSMEAREQRKSCETKSLPRLKTTVHVVTCMFRLSTPTNVGIN